MDSFRVALVLAVVLHVVLAAPKLADKPIHAESDDILQELSAMGKDLHSSIMKVVPSSKDVSKLLIDASKQFAGAVEDITKSIKTYTKRHQGTVDDGLKEISARLLQVVSVLKKISHTVPEKATGIVDTISAEAQNVLAEASQVQEAVKVNLKDVQENVMTIAEKLYTELINAYTRLEKDVNHAWAQKS
ncbi:uncharacterized protein LOC116167204 [Photinus pyralis]|nr:uncharacterized protein LOC116167204 [Photinus pyralis]